MSPQQRDMMEHPGQEWRDIFLDFFFWNKDAYLGEIL